MRFFTIPQLMTMTSRKAASAAEQNSLFSSRESAWDNIFQDIRSMPPLISRSERKSDHRARRHQAMTAQEFSTFEDMFSMIFAAAGQAKQTSSSNNYQRALAPDFFGRVRTHGRNVQGATTESAEQLKAQLDRLREDMDLCDTDQLLLEWAMREVFGASRAAEEAARREMAAAVESSTPGARSKIPPLQPAWYPHVVAHLMSVFRDKYRDPHLALAIFDHTAKLSIVSYVFGCTTPTYNELLETKWRAFKDLQGCVDALEEMRTNAVTPDSRTRAIVESMRQEIMSNNGFDHGESEESLVLLERADKLAAQGRQWKHAKKDIGARSEKESSRPSRWKNSREWKRAARDETQEDTYEFNNWEASEGNREREDRY